MTIVIDELEARVLLELLRERELKILGGRRLGTADSDVNAVALGVTHGIVTKIDDAYIRSAA